MAGVVVFNFEEFTSFYPEVGLSQNKATWAFNLATLMLNNSPCSIVCCLEERKQLLYLLTAHIGFLDKRGGDSIGAVTNASEGSVSVGFGGIGKLGQNYFWQTQYGLLFWQLVRKYMSGFYVPEC